VMQMMHAVEVIAFGCAPAG